MVVECAKHGFVDPLFHSKLLKEVFLCRDALPQRVSFVSFRLEHLTHHLTSVKICLHTHTHTNVGFRYLAFKVPISMGVSLGFVRVAIVSCSNKCSLLEILGVIAKLAYVK